MQSMRRWKQIDGAYLLAIGTGSSGTAITKAEYDAILAVIRACPQEAGKGYRLKTDLTWEIYDLPPEETEPGA